MHRTHTYRLISLAELALSLDPPSVLGGWPAYLARRGIAVVPDDLGRPSIPRSAARELIAEHQDNEASKARHRADAEQRAVEADQQWRASLYAGLPAERVPGGMTAGMLMMASDPMDQGPAGSPCSSTHSARKRASSSIHSTRTATQHEPPGPACR